MCAGMKIENIFWLSALKKDKGILLLIVELDDTKMANILIEKELVLDYALYKYIKYNSICKIEQCFNCYEYSYILIHYQKNTKCKACSGLYRTLEYLWDKIQKCLLCNKAYILWNKWYEHKKKTILK